MSAFGFGVLMGTSVLTLLSLYFKDTPIVLLWFGMMVGNLIGELFR